MAAWLGTVAQVANTGWNIYQGVTNPQPMPPSMEVGRGPSVGPMVGVGSSLVQSGVMTMPAAGLLPVVGGMARTIATRFGLLSRTTVGRRLVRIAKLIGIEAAAAAIGISIADALGLLGEHLGRRRRARGISARDLRTTRRTTRRLIRASQDLSTLASCVRVKRRSPC